MRQLNVCPGRFSGSLRRTLACVALFAGMFAPSCESQKMPYQIYDGPQRQPWEVVSVIVRGVQFGSAEIEVNSKLWTVGRWVEVLPGTYRVIIPVACNQDGHTVMEFGTTQFEGKFTAAAGDTVIYAATSGSQTFQVGGRECVGPAYSFTVTRNYYPSNPANPSSVVSPANADPTYKAKCQICHGATGTPGQGIGMALGVKPASDPEVQALTVEAMVLLVKNGKGKMPARKDNLTDQQIRNAVAYFQGLGKQPAASERGAEPAPVFAKP